MSIDDALNGVDPLHHPVESGQLRHETGLLSATRYRPLAHTVHGRWGRPPTACFQGHVRLRKLGGDQTGPGIELTDRTGKFPVTYLCTNPYPSLSQCRARPGATARRPASSRDRRAVSSAKRHRHSYARGSTGQRFPAGEGPNPGSARSTCRNFFAHSALEDVVVGNTETVDNVYCFLPISLGSNDHESKSFPTQIAIWWIASSSMAGVLANDGILPVDRLSFRAFFLSSI